MHRHRFRVDHSPSPTAGSLLLPLLRYKPETVEIELGRYPRIVELREIMEQVGFGEMTESTVQFAYPLTDVQAYRDKAFSALLSIPEAAFQRGIERMEQDLRTGPGLFSSKLKVEICGLLW